MKKATLLIVSLCIFAMAFSGCTTPAQELAGEDAQESADVVEEPTEESTEEVVEEPIEEPVVREWLDIAYADQSEAQKLDIHLPETGNGPFPVIFYVHGGGFMMGDKTDQNSSLSWTDRGYALVRVNYRLSGEAIFPAAVYDVKAAVRFIKANAQKYSLDVDRIAAWGESAGGYLVSILGTSSGVTDLEDLEMGNADQTSDVQVVVDLFGPINFLTMDEEFDASDISTKQQSSDPESFTSTFLGASITKVPETVAMANPTTYISEDDPIFYIQHGQIDNLVPVQQSLNFANALAEILGEDKVSLKIYENGGHNSNEFRSEENWDLIFAFLDQHLK